MAISATTEGEKIIMLDGKIDGLHSKFDIAMEKIELVIASLEKLETTRVGDHEKRILLLEKSDNERAGMFKLYKFMIGFIGLIVALLTILQFKK